jgi:chromosome segregation ATPase
MVTSNHHPNRDQHNRTLISLSNTNLELETRFQNAQQRCRKMEKEAAKRELQISELERLVRSLASSDEARVLEERTQVIVDLTLKVEGLHMLLMKESQETPKTLSQPGHQPAPAMTDGGRDARQRENTSTTPVHEMAGTATVASSDCNTQRRDMIMALEKELGSYRSRNETLQRSVTTLKIKNTERELRAMKSLRQMRKQIDMLEHDRRRRQDIQTDLEERVAALEVEKVADSKEIQRLSEKCIKLETDIRHASLCGGLLDRSDKKNARSIVQPCDNAGDKPIWVLLSKRSGREDLGTSTSKIFSHVKALEDSDDNDVARNEAGSDCSATEASTVSHVASDVYPYY